MRLALAFLLLAGPAAAATSQPRWGVLLLAYGGGSQWRPAIAAVRQALPGVPVEAVDRAERMPIQRALDKLKSSGAGKVVAVPLEPLGESAVMDQTRYLFGVREGWIEDRPDRTAAKTIKPVQQAALKLERRDGSPRRLEFRGELVLTATIDAGSSLTDILADRARALSRQPAREALLLVGMAPNSDERLEGWATAAKAVAEQARAKTGFREAAVAWVREGGRAAQRDKDRDSLRRTLRELATRGGVVAVPLALDGQRLTIMLKRESAGSSAYRWDGKALAGDARLTDWIASVAKAASVLPDSRQFRDDSSGGLR